MSEEYNSIVSDCANQGRAIARALANEGIMDPLYLYARKSEPGKGSGCLFLVRDSAPIPPGVELVTGEGLRANIPYASYFQWVHDRAKRAPILAYSKAA